MRFRNRITLQSQTRTTFTGGCFTCTWGTVGTYWAQVTEEGGENYIAEKGQQNTILKIIVRAAALDIDKSIHRFLFEDRVVHIKNSNDKSNSNMHKIIIGEVEENVT